MKLKFKNQPDQVNIKMLENNINRTVSGFLIPTLSDKFIVPESPCDDPKIRRQCSSARHVGSGHYICDHYNAAVKYPHLLTEFYIEKNEGKQLKDFSPGSKLDIWWHCSKCVSGDIYCHTWPANMHDRSRGRNCPFCNGIGPAKKICLHENAASNPLLVAEYHECNIGKLCEYSYGSKEEVLWRCSVGCQSGDRNCHVWPASIKSRSNGSGCPFCTSGGVYKKVCEHENAANNPLLVSEWHESNPGKLSDFSYGSAVEVLWRCSIGCPFDKNCHVWPASIKSRSNGSGCPFCDNGGGVKRVCQHVNAANNPLLVAEWHERNNPKKLCDYSYGSDEMIWWRCSIGCPFDRDCHVWPASIESRSKGNKCPFCTSNTTRVCKHNNVTTKFPHLLLEFDVERNNGEKLENYSHGSTRKMWWNCSKTKNSPNPHKMWPAFIYNRSNGSGCPQCRVSKGEEMLVTSLTNLDIPFQREYSGISELGMKRFDFVIQVGKNYYLIEFDGEQHFKDVKFFSKKYSLTQRKHIDITKHLTALKYGFRMIRLDHTLDITEEIFRHHITTALTHSNTSYYATPSLYEHIISAEREFLTFKHLYTMEQLSQFIGYLANKYTKVEETLILEF